MRPARVLAMLVLAFVCSPLAPLRSSSARAPVVHVQTVNATSTVESLLPMLESTTSTTAASPPPTTSSTTSTTIAPSSTSDSVNGHPCGGRLPTCRVLRRETGGTGWATISHTPNCSGRFCEGKWQWDPVTWRSLDTGFEHAYDAPESVQDDEAARLWDGGRGCAHWNAC